MPRNLDIVSVGLDTQILVASVDATVQTPLPLHCPPHRVVSERNGAVAGSARSLEIDPPRCLCCSLDFEPRAARAAVEHSLPCFPGREFGFDLVAMLSEHVSAAEVPGDHTEENHVTIEQRLPAYRSNKTWNLRHRPVPIPDTCLETMDIQQIAPRFNSGYSGSAVPFPPRRTIASRMKAIDREQ